MARFALLILFFAAVVAGGCGKKKAPPAPAAAGGSTAPATKKATPSQATPTVKAPRGIPQEFAELVAEKWPIVQKEGDAFAAKFNEAKAARKEDDRAKLQASIEAARQHYTTLKDAWAEIAYWPINSADDGKITEDTATKCDSWIRDKSKIVTGWDKKAKGLKELSTVK